MTEPLEEAAREWHAAKQVINTWLGELHPLLAHLDYEHAAASLLARLASHKPPLIVVFVKEES